MKTDDIRPRDVMVGQRVAMAADIAWLETRRKSFEPAACPACAAAEHRPLYEKHGLSHVRCDACGSQYVTPRPPAGMLAEFYASSENYRYWAKHIFPASAGARRERIFAPRAAHVAGIARTHGLAGGTLVEVGAAYGWFCDAVQRLEIFGRIVGIEPTPDLAAVCRELGIEVIEATYEATLLDGPVEVIAAFEVIEHLHDPKAFLDWCFAGLRPGGFLYLSTPNIRGFETLALGRCSDTVDHEHINLFHPASLRQLAGRSGFGDIDIRTPGQLDVDLVREAARTGRVDEGRLGGFVAALTEMDEEARAGFQSWLQKAGLSSHMVMTAFRPAA